MGLNSDAFGKYELIFIPRVIKLCPSSAFCSEGGTLLKYMHAQGFESGMGCMP